MVDNGFCKYQIYNKYRHKFIIKIKLCKINKKKVLLTTPILHQNSLHLSQEQLFYGQMCQMSIDHDKHPFQNLQLHQMVSHQLYNNSDNNNI